MSFTLNRIETSPLSKRDMLPEAEIAPTRSSTEALPSVDAIIGKICRDACDDAMRFVLRSDVGHDGE